MSAFGGKADMTFRESPLSRSLSEVKRTWAVAPHMSAFDPKRTFHAFGGCRCVSIAWDDSHKKEQRRDEHNDGT